MRLAGHEERDVRLAASIKSGKNLDDQIQSALPSTADLATMHLHVGFGSTPAKL
jgi:hypothetical protein